MRLHIQRSILLQRIDEGGSAETLITGIQQFHFTVSATGGSLDRKGALRQFIQSGFLPGLGTTHFFTIVIIRSRAVETQHHGRSQHFFTFIYIGA